MAPILQPITKTADASPNSLFSTSSILNASAHMSCVAEKNPIARIKYTKIFKLSLGSTKLIDNMIRPVTN